MLQFQIGILTSYLRTSDRLRSATRAKLADESGEITSTVAIIGVLVVGALAAGAIVVARMRAHAEAIPNPGQGSSG